MKWINERGIYFPTSGEISFLDNPGNGVFQISISPDPMDKRLGLRRVSDESDKFKFDFKVYDVGHEDFKEKVKTIWRSKEYNKNLGIILNGTKGAGKTIFAKILCNELELPVILVDSDFEGRILQFITNLNFECVIFLDEAEKTFQENPEILLKLIDGAYNKTRKLYLLTTNTLKVDENLIDRPGRIRYIQEFGNLSQKAINECIEDNLKNLEHRDIIIDTINKLEFSTIDILKNIIEEVNILGPKSIYTDESNLNIPISSYTYYAISFEGLEPTKENIDRLLKRSAEIRDDKNTDKNLKEYSPEQFLKEFIKNKSGDYEFVYDMVVDEMKECNWVRDFEFRTTLSELRKGWKTNSGIILEVFDKTYPGFFIYKNDSSNSPTICLILNKRKPFCVNDVY